MKLKQMLAVFFGAAAAFPAAAALPAGSRAASPSPDWLENAVIYEANLRQGTSLRNLKGLRNELPRLRDLGVDVVWLMPVHPISEKERKGTFGSYYAVRDYKAVNPEFGTLDDLKDLVGAAHALGMKVILDEVCNHTGADHGWVTSNPDFYKLNEEGKMYGPFDWTDVCQLDYGNPALREEMASNLEYWVREADIDGYRCDVAGMVPVSFWEEVRPRLQAIKPVMMLAEADQPDLLLKAFDVDYAWPMKDTFNAIAATKGVNKWAAAHGENRPQADASSIVKLLRKQDKEYARGSRHMNMVTNHDLNSWEGTEFDRYGEGTAAFAVLSYTLPGVPMMYTGQEVGFDHPFEFFERDTVQPVYDPNEYTAFYRMLNSLKHRHPALNASAPVRFLPAGSDDVIVFERYNNGDRVMVFANLSSQPQQFDLAHFPSVEGMTDAFSGRPGKVPSTLGPWQYTVLVKE